MSPLKKLEVMASIALRRQDMSLRDTYDQYWASRCVLELQYACKLSESEDGAYDELVNGAIELAWKGWEVEKTITKAVAEEVEAYLAPIAEKAKS